MRFGDCRPRCAAFDLPLCFHHCTVDVNSVAGYQFVMSLLWISLKSVRSINSFLVQPNREDFVSLIACQSLWSFSLFS